ncbi:MAG: DinB family protein [Calditrichia bacterium]
MRKIKKPIPGEYPEYSRIYLDLLEDDGNILDQLWNNFLMIKQFIYDLPEEKLTYRYAEGKWTIKEILVHLIDDERIFAYRALRYARNDSTPLHGFEENHYATFSGANERSLESIFEEYEAVRKATITLFQYLPEEAFMRSGAGIDTDGSVVNERTVRGLAWHIAGHELRHFNVIKERYLS